STARERSEPQFVLCPDSAGRAGFCRVSIGHRSADRPERPNPHSSSRTTHTRRPCGIRGQPSVPPACEAGSRRGEPSWRTGQECLGFFERGYGGLAGNRRKVIEELIQAVTRLKIVDQRIDGHTGSSKAWSATQDLWIADDDRFALHGEALDFQ